MEEFFQTGGYLGIFGGIIIEGETVFLSAIAAAQLGYLNFRWILLTIFLAAQVHDWSVFLVSRRQGTALLERNPKWQAQSIKLQSWIGNKMLLLLLVYRFLIGFRMLSLLFIGLSKVNILRFALFSWISTLLWIAIVGTLGYFFTNAFIQHLEWIQKNIGWILGLLLAIGLIFWQLFGNKRPRNDSNTF
jgi:membrane protein DedA with SNARE-associated domain